MEHRLDAQRQRQELAERPERLDEFWTAGRKGRIRLIWNDFALGPRGFGREFITPDTDGYPELTDTGEPPRLVRMCITGSVVDVRRDGRRFNGRHFICRWSEFEDAFLAEGMPWLRHTIRHVLLTGHP